MTLIKTIIGIILLVLGRKVYWAFAACVGFVGGLTLATRLMHGSPEWLIILLGILGGIVGALLAIFLQQIAVGVIGFTAGGYVLLSLLDLVGLNLGGWVWLPFLIGGTIGAVLMYTFFDWTLITLSALAGASLVTEGFHFPLLLRGLLFIGLLIVGILIQAAILHGDNRTKTA